MLITDVYNTRAIAAYMTEEASNKIPFLGSAYFPDRKKMGIDLKWLKSHKGLGVALKPSTFDAIPTVRPRGKAEMTKEEMPLFRESMDIKETDMMELARINETDDPFLQPVIDSIYNDAQTLIDGAEISAEKMRMQLLAPVNGEPVIEIGMADNTLYKYDYDSDDSWKATNYLALSGTDTWDNGSSAKPLNDLRTAVQYLANNGIIATTVISNSSTLDLLLESDQIKNALITLMNQTIGFVDSATVEELIKRRMRLDWATYDKTYEDYDGTQKKFYPDGYVTIIGSGTLGSTWRGTTPEELTTLNNALDIPNAPVDITTLPNGIAVAIKTEYKPSFTVTTTASQIALPSFEGLDSVFVIKVK